MEFTNLVESARTCRRFVEDDALTIEDTAWLVDHARKCPSARNGQVLRYITVNSAEKKAEIFAHLHWAILLKGKGTPPAGELPTAYIAILMPEKADKFVHFDVGIVAQTMQLAARTKGWGCCMHGAFSSEKCMAVLGAPENMTIPLILALGKAKEICQLDEIPSDGSTSYWRDENKVHHVPKRSLKECILTQL